MSSNVYRGRDAPHYRLGHAIVLGYLAIGLLGGSVLNYILLKRENDKRTRGERDIWIQGLDGKQIEALGDQRCNRILSTLLAGTMTLTAPIGPIFCILCKVCPKSSVLFQPNVEMMRTYLYTPLHDSPPFCHAKPAKSGEGQVLI